MASERRRAWLGGNAATALLLGGAALVAWLRWGRHHVDRPAISPRDEVVTALVHFRDDIAGPADRGQLAARIVRVSAAQDASFAKYGDVYHHHVAPEPQESCLGAGNCYSDYLRFLADAEQAELGPAPSPELDARARSLAADLSIAALERDVNERVQYALERLSSPSGAAIRGDRDAKRTVVLLSTGHPIEAKRDAAIARILAAHPHDVRFLDVTRAQAPDVFDVLGKRLTAVAIVDGKVCKDVIAYEQWLELLFPTDAFPPPQHRYGDLALVDAHEHVAHEGGARLRELLSQEGARGAVVAALPPPTSAGIAAANEDALAAARADAPFVMPFVTIDDLSSDAPRAMNELIGRGARGLKLLTGHGDFRRARGNPRLDTPAVDAVLADLEKRGMPALWHVNTQVFGEGFLDELRRHPKLVIVDPHMAGYLTYAPSLLRRLFVQYPNLHVDLSFGTQPRYLRRAFEDLSARRDEWRALMTEYADRFLFGLDMVVGSDTSRAHARMLMNLYRSMLEDEEYDLDFFPARGWSSLAEESQHHAHMRGLALPREVLAKIYSGNAARLYGAPAP